MKSNIGFYVFALICLCVIAVMTPTMAIYATLRSLYLSCVGRIRRHRTVKQL